MWTSMRCNRHAQQALRRHNRAEKNPSTACETGIRVVELQGRQLTFVRHKGMSSKLAKLHSFLNLGSISLASCKDDHKLRRNKIPVSMPKINAQFFSCLAAASPHNYGDIRSY